MEGGGGDGDEMETEREIEKVILLICSYLAGIAVSDAVA